MIMNYEFLPGPFLAELARTALARAAAATAGPGPDMSIAAGRAGAPRASERGSR
jgi:hypothetical protein